MCFSAQRNLFLHPTDRKTGTRFFQIKILPTSLWNACNFVIQIFFKHAHIPGKNKRAAEYFSRLEIDSTQQFVPNIREDIETNSIQFNVQSVGASEAEQIFYADDEELTEN